LSNSTGTLVVFQTVELLINACKQTGVVYGLTLPCSYHQGLGAALVLLRALQMPRRVAMLLVILVGHATALTANTTSVEQRPDAAQAPARAETDNATKLYKLLLSGYAATVPPQGVVVQNEMFLEQLVEVNTPRQTFTIQVRSIHESQSLSFPDREMNDLTLWSGARSLPELLTCHVVANFWQYWSRRYWTDPRLSWNASEWPDVPVRIFCEPCRAARRSPVHQVHHAWVPHHALSM